MDTYPKNSASFLSGIISDNQALATPGVADKTREIKIKDVRTKIFEFPKTRSKIAKTLI